MIQSLHKNLGMLSYHYENDYDNLYVKDERDGPVMML